MKQEPPTTRAEVEQVKKQLAAMVEETALMLSLVRTQRGGILSILHNLTSLYEKIGNIQTMLETIEQLAPPKK